MALTTPAAAARTAAVARASSAEVASREGVTRESDGRFWTMALVAAPSAISSPKARMEACPLRAA